PIADAAALLRTLIIPHPPDERTSPAELAELAECCARLPLALRIAAESASSGRGHNPAELLSGLRDEQRRLDVLDAAGDPRTAVRSVFSWSYQHLSTAGAHAFALLGLHPSRAFDAYALAALANIDLTTANTLIAELSRAHLLEPTADDTYAMHDLLRAYAEEQAEASQGPGELHAALDRLFDHYLGTAAAAMNTLFPHDRHSRPAPPPPLAPRPPIADPNS